MNRKIYIWGIILFNLCICAMGMYFIFSDRDFSASQKGKSVWIGACYTDLNNSYYRVMNNEIRSVVEEYGDILVTRDSALDQEKQNKQIYKMLDQGIKGLFVHPVDSEGVLPALREARSRGVFVVAVDTGISDSSLVDSTVMTDRYSGGAQMANYLMAQTERSRVVLLEQEGVLAAEQCVQGFKESLETNENFTVAAEQVCNGRMEQGMEALKNVIDSACEFDAVFAVNDPTALGALAELEREGITNRRIMGVDGSPDGKSMVKSRKMMATMAQYPVELGHQAAENMYMLLKGETVRSETLLPFKLITWYTIDAYDTDKW